MSDADKIAALEADYSSAVKELQEAHDKLDMSAVEIYELQREVEQLALENWRLRGDANVEARRQWDKDGGK